MALTWDVSRIKNNETVTADPDDKDKWHPTTQALVWLCMFVGINEINEKNWKEFYRRVRFYERATGAYRRRYVDGKPVDQFITVEEVQSHIGLVTNVTSITTATFAKKVYEQANCDADAEIRSFLGEPL